MEGGGHGLIYVEYISRRPGVPLGEFHTAMMAAQRDWAAGHGEDRLIWSGARTWRLGPEPEYVHVWYSPGIGLERLDEWDRLFRAGASEQHERNSGRVARIDAAGCYEPLLEPVAAPGARSPDRPHHAYYAEYFRATEPLAAVRAAYTARAGRHTRLVLNLLAYRIGRLGPEPGGLAIWTLPDFGALSAIARDLDGQRAPVEPVAAGTYADTGLEIL